MVPLERFTIGLGDRFAQQGCAQLAAVQDACRQGIDIFPVWNKSNREHTIVGSHPDDLRREADEAVSSLGWQGSYYVDADHVGLQSVDRFLTASNFFTIDVAESIGIPMPAAQIRRVAKTLMPLVGTIDVAGLPGGLTIDENMAAETVAIFLPAAEEAGRVYRHIASCRPDDAFVTEVSLDETAVAQTPGQILLILKMLADEGIPTQTIAPKFTGQFLKGVDYVGDCGTFEREFRSHLHVLAYAREHFRLPSTLKVSIHSGSDKFSLYPIINGLLRDHGAGVHLKTAGTTWLEEIIGLAESDGDGLTLTKEIYAQAYAHANELIAPYATVVEIDQARLPLPEKVARWTAEEYVSALRHVPSCPAYNRDFRQLLHVAFKIAAAMENTYIDAVRRHSMIVGQNVTENLLVRHIRPLLG